MSLQSAIYVGRVRHRRRQPQHRFTVPLFLVYLDLSEIDAVLSLTRLWGRSRWCPARFRREDYLEPSVRDLAEAARGVVAERLGFRPSGPIRLLTHLRYFGYVFNPVSFYYCFDQGEQLAAVVAEITNTPWGERRAYVLDARRGAGAEGRRMLRWRFAKDFHVSPFLPMHLEYDWMFEVPGPSLSVHMSLHDLENAGEKSFDATLVMERREISPRLLRRLLVRYPLMTAQVIARIHLEALRLWLARVRVYPHPGRAEPLPAAPRSAPRRLP